MARNVLMAAGLLSLARALTVEKQDGGNVGLLVATDDNVTYDSSIVDSIQVANATWNSSVPRIVPQLAAFYPAGRFAIKVNYKPVVKKFEDALFTVTVTKGTALILNANVTVTFQAIGQPISTLILVDTGLGADFTKDDGEYRGIFSKFVGIGRYTVHFYASDTPNSVFRDYFAHRKEQLQAQPKRDSSSPWMSRVSTQFSPTGPFSVTDKYRSMNVRADLFERDVPPGPVSLFKVNDTDGVHTDGRRIWTFTWFNGGDHAYDGTAASFELRYSTDRDKLRRDFSSCDIVDPASDLVGGSLVPQPAYTAQAAQFIVPLSLTQKLQDSGKKSLTVFFDMKPVSTTGIIGEGLPISVHKHLCPGTGPCSPTIGGDVNDTTVQATTIKPGTTVPTATGSTTTDSTTVKVATVSTITTDHTGAVPTQPVPSTVQQTTTEPGTTVPTATDSTITDSTTVKVATVSTITTDHTGAASTQPGPPTEITAKESDNIPRPTTTAPPSPDKKSEGHGSGGASNEEPAEEMEGSASNFTHVAALLSSAILAMGICLGCAIYFSTRKQEPEEVLAPLNETAASNM